MESAIQLARCLRDLSDAPSAFAAYERLRRPRVKKIAARGARISHAKGPGPIAQRMMRLMLPIMMATMNEVPLVFERRNQQLRRNLAFSISLGD